MNGPWWPLFFGLGLLLLTGCGSKENDKVQEDLVQTEIRRRFEEKIQAAENALTANEYEVAIKNYEEALRLKEAPQIRDMLTKARKDWEEFRKAAHDQALAKGNEARKAGRNEEAIAAFQEALRHEPKDKEAVSALTEVEYLHFMGIGKAAYQSGRFGEAIPALREVLKRKPEDKEVQELLKKAEESRRGQAMVEGRAAMQANKYPQAVRLFSEAKDLGSDAEVAGLLTEAKFQANLQLGVQGIEAKNYGEAIQVLEIALQTKPDHEEGLALLQEAKDLKEVQDQADYGRALSSGKSALSSRRYDDAIRGFQNAKQIYPQKQEALSLLREAERKKREYEGHMRSGNTALRSGRYDNAISEFRSASFIAPFGNSDASRLIREAESKKRDESLEAATKQRNKKGK